MVIGDAAPLRKRGLDTTGNYICAMFSDPSSSQIPVLRLPCRTDLPATSKPIPGSSSGLAGSVNLGFAGARNTTPRGSQDEDIQDVLNNNSELPWAAACRRHRLGVSQVTNPPEVPMWTGRSPPADNNGARSMVDEPP